MAVKISKLWGNNKFNNLTNNSKLFYIYLVTNPSINSVGVLLLNFKVVEAQTSLSIEQIRVSTKELISNGYLYVKQYKQIVYFIIPSHFNTLAKSDSTILKITSDLESLPDDLVLFLDSIGISISMKVVKFIKPSKTEVLDYAVSKGYKINADTFINYYEEQAKSLGKTDVWVNSRGKIVKDWKATLRKVWFKDENKLKACKGAPKGYEYFYIELNGNSFTPDFWRNGLPQSKDFLISKELKKQYERISK